MQEEIVFIKYMKTFEKVSNIIKNKFNSKLISSQNYLKAENKNTKGGFQYWFAPIMLIDSVHRKDQNYYPKASFKKCFIADIEIFCSNSDEKHYDEECINLFLKSFKK